MWIRIQEVEGVIWKCYILSSTFFGINGNECGAEAALAFHSGDRRIYLLRIYIYIYNIEL